MEPAPARPHHETIDHDDLLVHNCRVTQLTRPRIPGPLASGVLTGKYTRSSTSPEGSGRARHAARRVNEETFAVLDVLEAVSEDLGSPMAAVALAWVRQQPEVTSTIIGARTVDQLDANLSSLQRTPMFKPAGQAAEGIAWAATAPELAGHPGALYMRGKQLSLKGAATDRSLAARVWRISEQQTEIDPARSAVAAVSAAGGPDA